MNKNRGKIKKPVAENSIVKEAYKAKASKIVFQLEPSKGVTSFVSNLVWIYGRPKIGKSTLASKIDGAYFLATEPAHKSLRVRKSNIPNWKTFIEFVKKMEEQDTSSVKMFVVDTVDNLSKFCMQYVCGRDDMSHPSEGEWGRGWDAIRDEFAFWILKLCAIGPGVLFVSHEVEKEVVSRSMKIDRAGPALPKTTFAILNNLCDIILRMCNDVELKKKEMKRVEQRCLVSRSSDNMEAGDRTGILPPRLFFNTEQEAVDKIMELYESKKKLAKKGAN